MYAWLLPANSSMIRTGDLREGSVKAGAVSAFKSSCMNETNQVGSDARINPGQSYTEVTVKQTPRVVFAYSRMSLLWYWSEQHIDFTTVAFTPNL